MTKAAAQVEQQPCPKCGKGEHRTCWLPDCPPFRDAISQPVPAAVVPRASSCLMNRAVQHGADSYAEWNAAMAAASLRADDRIKADKLVPEWERNARTGGRDPWAA